MPSGLLDPSTACPLYSQALPCSPRPSHPVVKLSSSSCTIPLAQKHSRPPHAHLHLFPHDTHRCLSRTHVFLLAASNLTFLGLSALWAILSLRNDPLGPPLRVPTSLLLLFLRIYRLSLFFFTTSQCPTVSRPSTWVGLPGLLLLGTRALFYSPISPPQALRTRVRHASCTCPQIYRSPSPRLSNISSPALFTPVHLMTRPAPSIHAP